MTRSQFISLLKFTIELFSNCWKQIWKENSGSLETGQFSNCPGDWWKVFRRYQMFHSLLIFLTWATKTVCFLIENVFLFLIFLIVWAEKRNRNTIHVRLTFECSVDILAPVSVKSGPRNLGEQCWLYFSLKSVSYEKSFSIVLQTNYNMMQNLKSILQSSLMLHRLGKRADYLQIVLWAW